MMTTTDCPTPAQLRAMSLGELSSEDSDHLLAHLGECSACQSELETIEDVEDSLIASLRDKEASADFDAEPDCKVALAKALGALAQSDESHWESSDDRVDGSFPKLPDPGATIGEYEIVRPLGQGGMGNVFLARHTKLGREVAVKLLASHRLADPRMRNRFEAEMRAVGKLSHPNIVTAHDARDVDGTAVLVTEFIDGLDLRQLLKRTGRLSISDACDISRMIAVALQYTSSQGFVHRDVKPSNIMLSSNGEVKLLDLGLARLQFNDNDRSDMTATGQAMGTADYVAPEQITDSRTVDVRADIYSLGCTLFKLLSGRVPFADAKYTTTFAKMTAHVSEAAPSVSQLREDVPSELTQLVDSMLAKEPSARPQSAGAVAERLAKFCANSDLNMLAETAATMEPSPEPSTSNSAANRRRKPNPNPKKPWLIRPVPMFAAIAAGLVGVAIGIAFGIIVTVEYPDGSRSQHEFPDGSKLTIKETPETDKTSAKKKVVYDATPIENANAETNRLLARRQAISTNKLKILALVMINYESAMGKFPGTENTTEANTQEKGQKVFPYSWRVAILPFIERQDLYNYYRFHEPWNSEHNAKLLDKMPEIFRSPHDNSSSEAIRNSTTNYFGFVGENTALGTGDGLKVSSFKDGTSETLLIVESNQSTPWTMPRDLTYSPIISNSFSGVPLMFAMADGAVRTTDESNVELMKKIISRNGGELVDFKEFDSKSKNESARSLPLRMIPEGVTQLQRFWEWTNPTNGERCVTGFLGSRFASSTADSIKTGTFSVNTLLHGPTAMSVSLRLDASDGEHQIYDCNIIPIGTQMLVRIKSSKGDPIATVNMKGISNPKADPVARRLLDVLEPLVDADYGGHARYRQYRRTSKESGNSRSAN